MTYGSRFSMAAFLVTSVLLGGCGSSEGMVGTESRFTSTVGARTTGAQSTTTASDNGKTLPAAVFMDDVGLLLDADCYGNWLGPACWLINNPPKSPGTTMKGPPTPKQLLRDPPQNCTGEAVDQILKWTNDQIRNFCKKPPDVSPTREPVRIPIPVKIPQPQPVVDPGSTAVCAATAVGIGYCTYKFVRTCGAGFAAGPFGACVSALAP